MLGLFKGYRPKRIGSRFGRIGFAFFISFTGKLLVY